MYVSNTYANDGYVNGSIQIFAPGSTSPTGSIADGNIYFSFFVACDPAGNVWYDYLDKNFVTGIAEYVPSTATIIQFGSLGIAFPGGIRSLGKGLLSINDQSSSQSDGSVQIFDTSNMAGGPISSITGFADPVSGSWNKADTAMWQADITDQRVDYATLAGTPQIRYSIGSGVLYGPVDALVSRPAIGNMNRPFRRRRSRGTPKASRPGGRASGLAPSSGRRASMVIITVPVSWPDATYGNASAMLCNGYLLFICGLKRPFSVKSLINAKPALMSFGGPNPTT